MNISNSSFQNDSMSEQHDLLQMALYDNLENAPHIFNSLPYSIAAVFENKIVFANNKLLELVELNHLSEIMHKNLTEIFTFQTEKGGLHIEEILESLNAVQTRTIETQILCFNGLLKNVQIHTNPMVFRKGILQILSFYDQTEKIRIEKQLLQSQKKLYESEQTYKTLIELLPDAIFVQTKGKFVFVNKAAKKLLGIEDSNQIVGKKLLDFVHTDYQAAAKKRLLDLIKHRKSVSLFNSKIIRTDGQVLDIESAGSTITYDEQPSAIMVIRDITKRKCIERRLRESEERYRLLITSFPSAVYVYDGETILFTNPKGAQLLAANNPKEIIGTSLYDYIHPARKEVLSKKITEIFKNQITPNLIEETAVRLDGKELNIQIQAVPFQYEGKLALLIIMDDLFEKNQLVDLKKKMLENKKLLDETLEYDKVKTEFFSNLSHEFRTPLNMINSSLQLLSLHLTDIEMSNKDKIDKCTTIMKQNCNRLLRLINNLIDITRIYSGFFDLALQNYDIVSLVQQIINSVSTYTENKGIVLTFSASIKKKMIACDPDKIERILLNLLSNAIKFNQPGGSIIVKLYQYKKQIAISIKDTGIGISKHNLPILFQRFRQVDKSLSRNQEGSGLGLSIAKSLVELHQGRIAVKSVLGKGSEFIVYLPIHKIEQPLQFMNANELLQSDRIERMNIEFSDIYM